MHVDVPSGGGGGAAAQAADQNKADGQVHFGTGVALPDDGGNQQKTEEGNKQKTEEGSEYLFEDANQRYLTQADVSGLTAQAACYAKNEIYARRGRKFNSVELQEYFGSKSWYNGTIDPASFTGSQFNDYELKNIEILKNKEFSLASGGYLLDQPGYNINAVGTISLK